MHVIVVGCGLGGLACAIGCRHEGLEVTVLEQSTELDEVGHHRAIYISEQR
jgi:salicylate hydroxylase